MVSSRVLPLAQNAASAGVFATVVTGPPPGDVGGGFVVTGPFVVTVVGATSVVGGVEVVTRVVAVVPGAVPGVLPEVVRSASAPPASVVVAGGEVLPEEVATSADVVQAPIVSARQTRPATSAAVRGDLDRAAAGRSPGVVGVGCDVLVIGVPLAARPITLDPRHAPPPGACGRGSLLPSPGWLPGALGGDTPLVGGAQRCITGAETGSLMGIVDEDIVRVRDSSDIVAVISEHVQLKRVGRRWQGICPFHSEKSASFSVNQEEGLYYCFGCHAKGDVITFVREIEHVDFVGAVEKLAAKAGVTLRYTDQNEGESRKRKNVLIDAVRQAVDWYHDRLLSGDDAAPARKYLRSRGLSGDEVRAYQLGWAPEGWDTLAKALKLPDDVLVDSGLGFLNRNNRQTDAFRGRILFPIFDVNGNPVAFGGRIMPGSSDPAKYKNSMGTRIYDKSKTLYGLHWAKGEIVNADEAIVCEGYTDVIGFAAAGLPRAVATCGTSLTEDHFRVLKSYAHRIVLAFDADAAGQNAAERFYEWERQYDIDVAVAALPPGVDPGDLSRSDPDALRAAVDNAVPFLKFRLDRVLTAASLATAEGRARAAEAALEAIREHPNALVRDQYVMEVASRTRIDVEQLRPGAVPRPKSSSDRSGQRGTKERPGRPVAPDAVSRQVSAASAVNVTPAEEDEYGGWFDDPTDPGPAGVDARPRGKAVAVDRPEPRVPAPPPSRESAELEALRLLINRPEEIRPMLHEAFFTDWRALAAYRALAGNGSVRDAIVATDAEAGELIMRLTAEDSEAEPEDVVDLLILSASTRELTELAAQARLAEDPLAYSADMGWVKLRLEELREPDSSEVAREQLVTWLTQQPEEQE